MSIPGVYSAENEYTFANDDGPNDGPFFNHQKDQKESMVKINSWVQLNPNRYVRRSVTKAKSKLPATHPRNNDSRASLNSKNCTSFAADSDNIDGNIYGLREVNSMNTSM